LARPTRRCGTAKHHGPCDAPQSRQDLVDYLEKYKARDGHIAELCRHLAGVSALDRPTDDGLLERARS
jgi:hypothetical protein